MAWLAGRPRPDPRLLAGVAVIAIVAIGVGLVMQGQRPTAPKPSAGASALPGSSATSIPGTSPAGQWGALDLAPIPAVASLEPTAQDDTGIAADAAFTLTSLAGDSATALAERLEVTPPTALAVTQLSATKVTVKPAKPLEAGGTYRFALRSPDGATAGSWLFRVSGPVHVTSTIPGDATTGVPVRTGIEVTFNQDGVADMRDHFTISPAVTGKFERHGRTQVFVPDDLKAATLYTVTVRAGLARTGTDLALPADVTFSFETGGPGTSKDRIVFGREVIEASPTERPVVAMRIVRADLAQGAPKVPAKAEVRVYRIPSLDAAAGTLSTFLAAPRWSHYAEPLMPIDGLPVTTSFTATLEPLRDDLLLIRFPATLDPGRYVVEVEATGKAHAFLQITPVSAWVSVLKDKTVVWVNDVTSGRALRDATLSLGEGPAFGRSNADGLAIADTPIGLVPPAAAAGAAGALPWPILRVTSVAGDTLLVPFDVAGDGVAYRGEWSEKATAADDTYWAMLFTDRDLYRTDDRIEVWGYLRGRDDARVPASVELRLLSPAAGDSPQQPSITSASATPGTSGAFTATLPMAGVPIGSYQVQAVVDGRVVVARWVTVSIIRKPPYQLQLSMDRRAVLATDKVNVTAAATFFDGTPVPSLGLQLAVGGPNETTQPVTTDASGLATHSFTARTYGPEDAEHLGVSANPTGPEAAEIYANAEVLVFPSAYDLKATGVVQDGRLRVTGSLHAVDLAKAERQLRDGTWDGDAAGAPVGGKTIQVAVTELIPVRRLVGNDYDFVEKIVRPRYEYDITRKPLRTLTARSVANGGITVDIAVPDPTHEYEVVLSLKDDAGRSQQRTINAGQPVEQWWSRLGVVFKTADGQPVDSATYSIGEQIAWQMIDEGSELPSGENDRYLYIVAQRGLRSAVITDASTFRRTFEAADAPGVFVIGVRFTGKTYAPKAASWANFDPAERKINVAVSAARERYRPGEEVTLSVRTTRPDGTPVSASVVVQAVDEKIYAIGGASVPRPLEDLYQRVDSGILRLTATHQVPTMSGREGEGGDVAGPGGGRTDFKDTLLFREVTTDASGRADLTVKLSDDLTSWHVTASAVTAGLDGGVGEVLVPVGLPFFVEATIADTYLVSDRPVIRLRAYGDALRAGDPVEFTVQSPALGLAATKVSGKAFEAVGLELPALSLGSRSVDVTATATTRKDTAGKALSDRLIRSFEVVTSRLTAARSGYALLRDGLPAVGQAPGLATYTFTDAGRGRYLPILLQLTEPGGARLDRSLAQALARQRLIVDFGRDPASLPPLEFDPFRYPMAVPGGDDAGGTVPGIALLPYGGVDPWLAARVAVVAPGTFDPSRLRDVLLGIRDHPSTQRDLAIANFAALAAIGEPVLADLREARAEADLTAMERIYLALGFEALGDDASALEIERDLLDRDGEKLGPWVRLRMGGSLSASVEATALLSVVAAGLGDPVAAGLAEYVQSNPGTESTQALELAAYAARGVERTRPGAVSFAYTVGGTRTVVALEPGEAATLSLTADQRAGLSTEVIAGQVAVAVESRVIVEPGTLKAHPALTLKRAVPPNPVPADGFVVVELTATFAAGALENGCYDVTELVPSGLAPLEIGRGEPDERGVIGPSSVVGQEVTFCATNDPRTGHTARMGYKARVVNEGTFTWEPAVMQLAGAPEALAVAPAGTTTIGSR
jgi:hypothetical protein